MTEWEFFVGGRATICGVLRQWSWMVKVYAAIAFHIWLYESGAFLIQILRTTVSGEKSVHASKPWQGAKYVQDWDFSCKENVLSCLDTSMESFVAIMVIDWDNVYFRSVRLELKYYLSVLLSVHCHTIADFTRRQI